MKKSYLLWFPLFLLALCNLVSCSEEGEGVENVIEYSQLPEEAKTFLDQYFYNIEVTKVTKETYSDMVIYQVNLDNGIAIDFNEDGIWTQVDAPFGKTIPTGFIPEPIMQSLNYNYNGYGINQINREGENYHIVLTNNQGGDSIDLIYNQSGEIINQGTV